jgi:hypothetical protein
MQKTKIQEHAASRKRNSGKNQIITLKNKTPKICVFAEKNTFQPAKS